MTIFENQVLALFKEGLQEVSPRTGYRHVAIADDNKIPLLTRPLQFELERRRLITLISNNVYAFMILFYMIFVIFYFNIRNYISV